MSTWSFDTGTPPQLSDMPKIESPCCLKRLLFTPLQMNLEVGRGKLLSSRGALFELPCEFA